MTDVFHAALLKMDEAVRSRLESLETEADEHFPGNPLSGLVKRAPEELIGIFISS